MPVTIRTGNLKYKNSNGQYVGIGAVGSGDIAGAVEDWMDENLSNPDSPPLDRSLSLNNAAAPADLVGDLKNETDALNDAVFEPTPSSSASSFDVTGYQGKTLPKVTSSINESTAISSVKLYCCGKNHLKLKNASGGSGGFTWQSSTDGTVTLNGTANQKYYLYFGTDSDSTIGEVLNVISTRWRASITKSAVNNAVQIGFNGEGQGDYYNYYDTTSKYSNSVGIIIPSGTVCDNLVVYPMLEYGDYRQETTFTYEAFSGFVKEEAFSPSVTTATVDWGEVEIPENATTMWHYKATNLITIYEQTSAIANIKNDIESIDNSIVGIEADMADLPEFIRYDLSNVTANQTWTGMKLDGEGGWEWLTGYNIERYGLNGFDKLYLVLNEAPSANYEFHSDSTLAASSLVGETYNTKVNGLVSIPDTATNVFICFSDSDSSKQIKKATNWVDDMNSKINELYTSSGNGSSFANASTKTADTLTICENYHLKKGFTIDFYGEFENYAYIEIGQGINSAQGRSVKITSSAIELYFGGSNGTTSKSLQHSENHGLTLSGYIYVKIDVDEKSYMKVSLMSNGASVTKSMGAAQGGKGNCEAYISGTMTNIKGSLMATGSLYDVFIFGDSYTNPFATSYTKHLLLNGYTKFLLSGFPGDTGAIEINAFSTAVTLHKPKIALWALGMNDGGFSPWKTSADQFISICESKGIVPVLATIPNVANKKDNTSINSYVKSSGYRYVDFAKAVGAESADSTWYEGMLINNDIHPTDLGGIALMNMLFVDLPEIASAYDPNEVSES